MAGGPRQTPMMRQYMALKEKHPDTVLFFRMGDFYEMFFEDAEIAADVLGLTLTSRDKGKKDAVPMAGLPWHAAEGYIAKLVRRGHRVAVCEQIGDPATTKGLVERRVVEVVTPGTALNESLVPATENNFAAAMHLTDDGVGLAAVDVSTGEFLLADLDHDRFAEESARLPIREWLVSDDSEIQPSAGSVSVVRRPSWWFEPERGRGDLQEQFGVRSLAGFDCDTLVPALGAGGALLRYLREVRGDALDHIIRPHRLTVDDVLVLDQTTRRNLELLESLNPATGDATLFGVMNRTVTSLGARRLRSWLERPLRRLEPIELRLDGVGELRERPEETGELKETLRGFRDLERLLSRAASGKAGPRDLHAIGAGAALEPRLRAVLGSFRAPVLADQELPALEDLGTRILRALVDEPPVSAGDGGLFRPGWNTELDELRERSHGGKKWIAALQEKERQATGISTLKVGFNRVFGYYLEVTKAHQDKVPDGYIRKQTLVNAERYVTPELKEEEERILGAEEKLKARELELFQELRRGVMERAADIQILASTVAASDALLSLARTAAEETWVRPVIREQPVLKVRDGRHPVVERLLPSGDFVPNDLDLSGDRRQIGLITGPNMAGKSTYLRQAGIIAILAHMGSFVPAAEAEVGLADRVFTRVGASDSIARGQSTFMVEMEETAVILNAATADSLVLLDEVGRGTSTYDGLSIAWAVTEHLHERDRGRPRTLFATHYHELTALAGKLDRVINLNVQVKEWNGKVVFLRRIVDGAADRSYGIHVAELAGLPDTVLDRSREILHQLEGGRFGRGGPGTPGDTTQLTLFEPVGGELLGELDAVDPDHMSPMDALAKLAEWKHRYGDTE